MGAAVTDCPREDGDGGAEIKLSPFICSITFGGRGAEQFANLNLSEEDNLHFENIIASFRNIFSVENFICPNYFQ